MRSAFRTVLFSVCLVLVLGVSTDLPAADEEVLMNPEGLVETAPDVYKVKFETSKGDFVIQVDRSWAPLGADRFYNLVKSGYYDDTRFFRVIEGFMVQWGIHGDPTVAEVWREAPIKDDPVEHSNVRGTISYAKPNAPNRRTTQVFINFGDNTRLDGMGFAPFGEVVEGMDVVDQLYSGYGEGAPRGNGPFQQRLMEEGNEYLLEFFPELDYVQKASIVE